jgi:hypothetical protein
MLRRAGSGYPQPSGSDVVRDNLRVFMLPNVKNVPTLFRQLIVVPAIPLGCRRKLRRPPVGVRLRKRPMYRTRVPEASIDKHCQPDSHKHQIRPTGQVRTVQPIANPPAMQRPAQGQLRAGVPRLLTSHESSNRLRGRRRSICPAIHAEPV